LESLQPPALPLGGNSHVPWSVRPARPFATALTDVTVRLRATISRPADTGGAGLAAMMAEAIASGRLWPSKSAVLDGACNARTENGSRIIIVPSASAPCSGRILSPAVGRSQPHAVSRNAPNPPISTAAVHTIRLMLLREREGDCS
jgi:hypothetical protein